jgi:hypothetical protein
MSYEWWIFIAILCLPLLVWVLARAVALAWFRTKREHTRRMLQELDPGPNGHQGEE